MNSSISRQPSIVIFIPYFGEWPEWIDLFFDAAKRNHSIDFIIYTDCQDLILDASNIFFHTITFQDYISEINKKLSFEFDPPNAYKLCDLRPLFGDMHKEQFKNYDFFGWCDLDLFFGDIRSFYSDELLNKYDVFSTHADRVSGHFALFRNNKRNRKMYRRIYRWKEALQNPEFVGIDEHGITNALTMTFLDKVNEKYNSRLLIRLNSFLSKRRKRKLYFVEQYTTPFLPIPWTDGTLNSQQPSKWKYFNGEVTNSRDIGVSFIYVHFMNFKSQRWRHDGTPAPWESLKKICTATIKDIGSGIIISPEGILPFKSN